MIISIPFFAVEFYIFSGEEYEHGYKSWRLTPEEQGVWNSRYRTGKTFVYNRFEINFFWGNAKL